VIESGRIDVDELKLQLDHDDNEDILHALNPSLAIEQLYERRGKIMRRGYGILTLSRLGARNFDPTKFERAVLT